ncbi:unnamed protein product [Trichobilharzia regenti]|nr:unnamed protein product [Trichobilharzia regenti]
MMDWNDTSHHTDQNGYEDDESEEDRDDDDDGEEVEQDVVDCLDDFQDAVYVELVTLSENDGGDTVVVVVDYDVDVGDDDEGSLTEVLKLMLMIKNYTKIDPDLQDDCTAWCFRRSVE